MMEGNTMEYKRILIINDDATEESFFEEYDNLKQYKNIIEYCGLEQLKKAVEFVISDNFGGFDKIILDIKIDWEIPDECNAEIKKYVDIDTINNKNIGFLLFMYLVSRGYPINRIAFLSAYIRKKDSEYKEKNELLEKIKQWKIRREKYDKELKEDLEKMPSLKIKLLEILEEYPIEEFPKETQVYDKIRGQLEDDIKSENLFDSEELKMSNEEFFKQLAGTGLKIQDSNKIDKGNKEKLCKWIVTEENEKLRKYYNFRSMALSICKSIAHIHEVRNKNNEENKNSEENKKTKKNKKNKKNNEMNSLAIYKLYDKQSNKDFEQNYPETYFQNLMEKIQYEISGFREEKDIEKIVGNVISNLVAYWESIDKKYIDPEKNIEESVNVHAITMVLKSTRNWYAHGRIEKLDVDFCEFIFLLSVKIIYGNEIVEDYVSEVLRLKGDKTSKNELSLYGIWKELNERIIKKSSKIGTYMLNVDDLYFQYSHEKIRTKVKLVICDLYKMFILCLHFPKVAHPSIDGESFKIEFNEIDYETQEPFMTCLEIIAKENLFSQECKSRCSESERCSLYK